MSSYANGSGTITLSRMNEKIKEIVNEAWECDITDGVEKDTYDVSVWVNDKYWDDYIQETLDSLAEYTVEGSIQYISDEDCIWRWIFDKTQKKWRCEPGDVVFWKDYDNNKLADDAVELFVKNLDEETRRKIYYEVQKEIDLEDLVSIGIERLEYQEDIPKLDDETKKRLAEAACDEYRSELDGNDTISEIRIQAAEEVIPWHLSSAIPVKGSYCLSNTGSVNVYYADSDRVFAGINDEKPEWYEIEEIEETGGEPRLGFRIGEIAVPVDEVMKVENGGI